MMVSLSGDCSHPNGVVFDLPQTAFVMYPALFTSVEGHLRANLGHSLFKYAAPSQEYVAFASLAPCDVKARRCCRSCCGADGTLFICK
jgi:hypothetical protein